jgi:hypothetical protein
MLSRLFFVINFFILGIVFALKTYYETSFEWFYSLPWLTFLNGFIDIAIKKEVESNIILTFWFVFTIFWLIFLIKEANFGNLNKNYKINDSENKPLDIDELERQSANNLESVIDKKNINNPESIGANFAAALSQAVSKNSSVNETTGSNSGFFEQANQALSSMPPEAAQKLRRVQTVLNDLEAAAKSEDLEKLTKKNLEI